VAAMVVAALRIAKRGTRKAGMILNFHHEFQ